MKKLIAAVALAALVGCGYVSNSETETTTNVTVVAPGSDAGTADAASVDAGTPDAGVDAGVQHGRGHHYGH